MRERIVVVVLIAFAVPVWADTLEATLAQDLFEVSHSVSARIEEGVATLRVRRTFANRGSKHDEAHLFIKLPPGAVATGLRIRAGKRWYDGELLGANKAREMYNELTGLGRFRPKDPALLQWLWADELELFVFPIAPGRASTVEYVLTVPTEYSQGRYHLAYPRTTGERLVNPVFTVEAPYASAISIDQRPVAAREATLGAPPPPPIAGRELELDGSHVVSALSTDWSGPARGNDPIRVQVRADIRHTFRGDLRVMLVTPWNQWISLHDQAGGSENDLQIDRELPIASERQMSMTGSWRLVISDLVGRDTGTLREWSLTMLGKGGAPAVVARTPIPIPDAPSSGGSVGMHRIVIEAPKIDTLTGRLGRVALVDGHHFSRVEIDMAKQLRPLPRNAQVVFVLDVSRSQEDQDIAAQLELARGYLEHVPDADFALVGVARYATTLVPFSPAARAQEILSKVAKGRTLIRQNGSALERGLAHASRMLATRSGPKRIVALTDGLLRPSWDNRIGIGVLASGPAAPLVHIALHSASGSAQSQRLDGHALAPIAMHTGGIAQRVEGLAASQRKSVPEAVLNLVRPTRIDNVKHDGPGGLEIPGTLEEGDAIRSMIEIDSSPRSIGIAGQIWAQPFATTVRASSTFSRATAGWVFSLDMHHDLDAEDQLKIALYGRAVSPVTSYLAIEPGVRPSTAGIDRGIGSTMGRGGGGAWGTVGRGTYGVVAVDWAKFFAAGVKRCRARHTTDEPVTIEVDTTKLEIVDVAVPGAVTPFRACVREASWKVELTTYNNERDRHVLRF